MKRHLYPLKRASILAFLVLVLLLSNARAGIISVQPPSLAVGPGPFSLDVQAAGVVDLYAIQFDIGFDPAVLEATGITEGPFLAGGGATIFIPGAIDNATGVISFTAISLETAITGVSGGGILATVNFQGVGSGSSAVTLFNVLALDSSLSGTDQTTQAGSVSVSGGGAVPEPSAGLFVLTGLLALVGRSAWRRRRAV